MTYVFFVVNNIFISGLISLTFALQFALYYDYVYEIMLTLIPFDFTCILKRINNIISLLFETFLACVEQFSCQRRNFSKAILNICTACTISKKRKNIEHGQGGCLMNPLSFPLSHLRFSLSFCSSL